MGELRVTETIKDFATRLIAGHNGGALIESVPEHLIPADLAGVYALQDAVIAQLGPVGGWKILAGGTGEPVCAPIPASRYFADGASISSTHHRFVLAEVEIAVKLARDLPANADAAMVEASIASVHPILEMVGSPFVDRDAIAANAKLGDLQSNGAVIVGPELDAAIRSQLSTLAVSLVLDGTAAKSTASGASWADIIAVIAWLSGHASGRHLPLQAGQVIITGARVVAPHLTAATIEGRAGDWGTVTAHMTY